MTLEMYQDQSCEQLIPRVILCLGGKRETLSRFYKGQNGNLVSVLQAL